MKQRRLGRGLEALLGRPAGAEGGDSWNETESVPIRQEDEGVVDDGRGIVWVDVYEIDRNPFQPRKEFDDSEIQQLAESMGQRISLAFNKYNKPQSYADVVRKLVDMHGLPVFLSIVFPEAVRSMEDRKSKEKQ